MSTGNHNLSHDFQLAHSKSGYGMSATFTGHVIGPDGKTTLCGRDATRWTREYQFWTKYDCKKCGKKAGLATQ